MLKETTRQGRGGLRRDQGAGQRRQAGRADVLPDNFDFWRVIITP